MVRILFAEDYAPLREILRAIISAHGGWSVCGDAADGETAVRLALELKPDLILLDLRMPVMDGLQAAAEILKVTPSVPVMLYTLHKDADIDSAAEKIGVRRVISKTKSLTALTMAIEEIIGASEKES